MLNRQSHARRQDPADMGSDLPHGMDDRLNRRSVI